MASLLRPLSRCLITAARKPNTLAMVNNAAFQQRFKSDNKGSLEKPLEKAPVDPKADPKESCNIQKFLILTNKKLQILNRFIYLDMADPWDLLYGAEKFEIAMKAKGITDPYDSEGAVRKAVSTKDDPNIVYVETSEDNRIVGCVCTPDSHHINYLYVHRGETKRCECGEWFKCVEREIPDLSEFGIHFEKSAHH